MDRIKITPITSELQVMMLKGWLESFDHKLPDPITGQFHLFTKGERTLALTQQQQINILTPAINPKVVSPRDTREIVDCFHHWGALIPGGVNVCLASDSTGHEFMNRLGFRAKFVIYESSAS